MRLASLHSDLGLRSALLASFASCLVAGCVQPSGEDGAEDGGEQPQPDDRLEPPDGTTDPLPLPLPPAPVPVPGGLYQVTTQLDLTIEALLPEPAEQLVVTLRNFSQHPAHTLIDLADAAGVPAVAELRAALPDALESRLEGWIDDELAKVRWAGAPLTQRAAEMAALAETTLTQVALHSELDLDLATGTATGAAQLASHRLTSLDFHPAGLDVVLPLAALPGDVTTATAARTVSPTALALGDHQFGLAYGEYAWRALEATCTTTYGAPLRAAIGAAVSCPTIASRLASKCILGVCVGHTAALTELCERGLDEVVNRARAKITAVRFTALHLAAGTATAADGADRLTAGVWTAEINAGQGLRPAPATFTAVR